MPSCRRRQRENMELALGKHVRVYVRVRVCMFDGWRVPEACDAEARYYSCSPLFITISKGIRQTIDSSSTLNFFNFSPHPRRVCGYALYSHSA